MLAFRDVEDLPCLQDHHEYIECGTMEAIEGARLRISPLKAAVEEGPWINRHHRNNPLANRDTVSK